MRGRCFRYLFAACAGLLATCAGAWADSPLAANEQSLPTAPITLNAILADAAIDTAPMLSVPSLQANSGARTQILAEATPPPSPCTKDAHPDPHSAQSNCPLTQKTGGVPIDFNQTNFTSPIFWLLQGQLFGISRLNVIPSEGDIYRSGVKARSYKTSEMEVQQAAQYGITDDLNVEVSFAEEPFNDKTESYYYPTAATIKTNTDGWEDPIVTLGYLLLSPEKHDPVYLYLNAGYTPNLFPANGPVADGAQKIDFGETLGYATGEYTFAALTTFTYVDKAGDPAPWVDHADLEFFDVLSPRWCYLLAAGYKISPGSGARGSIDLKGTLSYYIVPDRLQASLVYQHTFVGDDTAISGTPPQTFLYRDQSEDIIGVSLQYLFDLAPPD